MARTPKRPATIVDIAKKLGLSAMTVSRALNDRGDVSASTRQKVLRAAKTLGYQPNRWARSLVTRRSSIIGVIWPDIAHSFFAEITRGIEDVIEHAGYDILLCHSRNDPQREQMEIATLVASHVDGLIVASVQPEKQPAYFVELRERRTPFVLIDRYFPTAQLPSVRVDDQAVGELATRYLLELGHRRIAHIRGPALSTASLRLKGFRTTMREAAVDVPKEYVERGDFGIEQGRIAMRRLLALPERPTAVFAANDPLAIGAIYACREAGLNVPSDVSVVGAGNIEGIHHPNPFLTTIDWPRIAMGDAAAKLLLAAIRDEDSDFTASEVFAPTLLIRQSTAPVSQ